MTRIRWYGPTLVLLITVLFVLIAGPGLARRIEHSRKSQYIQNVREDLEGSQPLLALSDAFRKVAQVVEPSVVHIEVSARRPEMGRTGGPDEFWERFFGPRLHVEPREEQPDQGGGDFEQFNAPMRIGNGSGWVYDDQHIVTNRHVVHGADRITVRFFDRSERTATVVGTDEKTDIAVLKVEGGSLHPAARAPEPVEQGDIVFAFGSPFRFDFSMSQGIVSGKGRELGILGQGGYEYFIQTDAAINPGNSGGPLTNVFGQVVGMNTAIATRTGTYNGLGFAIPIDMVENVVEQLLTTGKVTRGYLGIFIRDLDDKLARTFGFDGEGVLVENPITGGPAEQAGIKRGDIVTEIDGKKVQTAAELRRIVARYEPGRVAKLRVFREGDYRDVEVKIEAQPEQVAGGPSLRGSDVAPPADAAATELLRKLGIESAATLDAETAERLGLATQTGVIVQRVRRGSVADANGIRRGNVIVDVQGQQVASVEEMVAELNKHDLTQGVRVTVMDGQTPRFVLLELPK